MGRPASGKWRAEPRSEPDSGHPTVRDRRGALGDVTHGEPRNPTRKSKERLWSLLAYRCARPGSIPTTRTSGSVGGQGQQRPWSTRPLSAEERRFHDTELQRLLQHAGAQTTVPADARFAEVAAIAHLVRRSPPSRRDAATRVFERSPGGAFLLVWLPRATDPARWSGVALSEQRLADILEPVLGSLLRGLPFVAAVRDPDDDPLWNPCRSCPRQPGRPCRSAASQSGHRAEDLSVSFPTER